MAKKWIAPVLCALLAILLTAAVWAREEVELLAIQSGECGATDDDHLTWTVDTAKGTLTISGTGAMADYAPWSSYEGKIKSIVVEEGVTSLDDYIFSRIPRLSSAVIASSVSEIPEGTFYECVELKSVTIGNGISHIGDGAFGECIRLNDVVLPDSVTHIDRGAFSNCKSLTTISFSKNLVSIGYNAFEECEKLNNVVIPDGVELIDSYAFSECYKLSSISIPDSVTYLGDGVFYHCYKLQSATVGKGISVIESSMFSGCADLTDLILPETVTTIKDYGYSWEDDCKINVYYAGTSTQWDAVKGDGKEYLDERAASIHYKSTGPENPGMVKPLTFTVSYPSFGVSIPLEVTGGGTRTANFFAAFYDDDNRFIGANGTQAIIFPRLQSVFVPIGQKFVPTVKAFAFDDDFKLLSPDIEQGKSYDDDLPEKYIAILEEPDEDNRNALINKLTGQQAKDFVKQFTAWLYG